MTSPPRSTSPRSPEPGQDGGQATAELAVGGMHCGSCAALIQEVLAEQPGVRAVSVDLDRGRARVEYDASQLDVDGLTQAIAGAGYSAAPLG